uniref:Uncharacterized protein n=1 Tax=Anopheles atroparvus TaxID=41427 RepID=A0A182J1Q9_ANOAO
MLVVEGVREDGGVRDVGGRGVRDVGGRGVVGQRGVRNSDGRRMVVGDGGGRGVVGEGSVRNGKGRGVVGHDGVGHGGGGDGLHDGGVGGLADDGVESVHGVGGVVDVSPYLSLHNITVAGLVLLLVVAGQRVLNIVAEAVLWGGRSGDSDRDRVDTDGDGGQDDEYLLSAPDGTRCWVERGRLGASDTMLPKDFEMKENEHEHRTII